jgi:DNA polymerase-3 subunit alpha
MLIYQEQVMQAAQIARRLHARRRGFAAARDGQEEGRGDAEASRHLREGLPARRTTFPKAKANQIFDLLEKFAGYGFNKSHAAAYAVVAYQTAYLKANYPVEFLCAMMTNDMGDTAKLSEYIAEAHHGHRGPAPDVNDGQMLFAPAHRAARSIRFGLAAIKGVGEVAVQTISRRAMKAGSSSRSLTCASAWTRAR